MPSPEREAPTLAALRAVRGQEAEGDFQAQWPVEYRIWLTQLLESNYLKVTDWKNLGAFALEAQDLWIADGASLERLKDVYMETRVFMEEMSKDLLGNLRAAFPSANVFFFASGDEGHWAFSGISKGDLVRVERVFTNFQSRLGHTEFPDMDIHQSSMFYIDQRKNHEASAKALLRARNELDEVKSAGKRQLL
jgi:hypothetical protein